MTKFKEIDALVNQLFENAVQAFRATEEYQLLKEKLDQMDNDCDCMLCPEENEFAQECFELVMDVDSQEEAYVYRKGLLDGVQLLKYLGVLA